MLIAALTRLRRRHGLRRDERGAFTLSELVLVGALSLIVLAIATTMLVTITGFATETTNKIDAEVRARQSLDTTMRYLRNAVPLAKCTRWSVETPNNVNRTDPTNMQYCNGLESVVPAVTPTSNGFTFYAYSADTGAGAGADQGSSKAPDRFTVTARPAAGAAQGRFVVERQAARSDVSMIAATCSVSPANCSGTMSPGNVWNGPTTIASLEVGSGNPFRYLSKNGVLGSAATQVNPADIRTVLVDLKVYYEGKPKPGYNCATSPCLNNKPRQEIAYNASASIRGAVYSDDKAGN